MSRSTFILVVSLYGLLLSLGMLFAPEPLLQGYGNPVKDTLHVVLFQFLGMSNLGVAIIGLLIRNAEPSLGLRAFLTGQAVTLVGGVALGVYHVTMMGVPNSTFFTVDSLWRLALGLGMVYYLMRLKPVASLA
ncbi:MAG: hypothetical protein H7Y12_04130 [Sphingobacteriaceae bacterium]|nr:hypothetical protein [Cytophagaceae bacterium]